MCRWCVVDVTWLENKIKMLLINWTRSQACGVGGKISDSRLRVLNGKGMKFVVE